MKINWIADHVQRNSGYLYKTGIEVWTYCQKNLLPRIQEGTLEAWIAYSTPAPSNYRQLLSLFLTCCCIAGSVGGLFYCWMFSSLQYSSQFSAAASLVTGLVVLWTLFLVHPARCMFTIIGPTLGTRQGRRLLLSACFVTVAVNIIPNIMGNIQAILQIIKCICKDSSESLLASTFLLSNASLDFSHSLREVPDKLPDKLWTRRDSHIHFKTQNNNFLLHQKMASASQGIKEDFMQAEVVVQKVMLLANRVSAGFFLCCLIYESAWYLKSYLTDLQFDNIYITQKLEDLLQEKRATHLLAYSSGKLIKSTGLKLTREEIMTYLTHIFLLTLVLMLTVITIATDYIAFHLAQAAVTEITQLPIVPVSFQIKYDVKLNFLPFLPYVLNNNIHMELSKSSFQRSYHHNLTFVSANCPIRYPNSPNTGVILAVGLLYCLIHVMVFLEMYSHRLCRKIAASFFENQEDNRVQYLYKKLVWKHETKEKEGQQKESTTAF
nr:osteoclast stimulatory transmembrane protein [Pogona vitticeps]